MFDWNQHLIVSQEMQSCIVDLLTKKFDVTVPSPNICRCINSHLLKFHGRKLLSYSLCNNPESFYNSNTPRDSSVLYNRDSNNHNSPKLKSENRIEEDSSLTTIDNRTLVNCPPKINPPRLVLVFS